MDVKKLRTGKWGELVVWEKLLRDGLDPYLPLVDVEGVDAVVRNRAGKWIELQVKTANTQKGPRWFQATKLGERKRDNYYIVCVAASVNPIEFWIIPAAKFVELATVSKETYDLPLDSKPRGKSRKRSELLAEFKGAWHLIIGGST